MNLHTRQLLPLFLLAMPLFSLAHTPNVAMEQAPAGNVVWFYLTLGIEHIIPDGFDHILFVVGLCLLNTKLKSILWQATAFTVAHSITLALSMKSIVTLPAEIVEPLIALSIAFIAIENLLTKELKPWRIAVVFLFGLIHGLGFAASLNEIGLPRNRFLTSIVSFNVGVELGQIAVILLVYLLLILPFGRNQHYRKWVVYPLSVVIGLVALWWVWERMG